MEGNGPAWLKTHAKLLRRFGLWLVIAAAMFAVSAWFTLRITYVDNHTPLDVFDRNFGRNSAGDPLPDEFHGEILSVMAPIGQGGETPIAVKYYTVGYGDTDVAGRKAAQIVFSIPAHRPLRIALNNLAADGQCYADGAVPPENTAAQGEKAGQGTFFTLPRTVIGGEAFAIMTLPDQDDDTYIKCWLTPDVVSETFTKRETLFAFTGPDSDLIYAPHIADSGRKFVDPAHDYAGYELVDAISLTVDIRGAEDQRFVGGQPDPQAADYDTTRLIEELGYTSVRWTDIFREQLRDIYLILIGTLIALAVTCIIEAIRPFVDGRLNEELEMEIEAAAPAPARKRQARTRPRKPKA